MYPGPLSSLPVSGCTADCPVNYKVPKKSVSNTDTLLFPSCMLSGCQVLLAHVLLLFFVGGLENKQPAVDQQSVSCSCPGKHTTTTGFHSCSVSGHVM